MGNFLTALFMAAGVAGLAYAKLGKRAGYGNSANVWTLVGMAFVITFIVFLVLFNFFFSLDS